MTVPADPEMGPRSIRYHDSDDPGVGGNTTFTDVGLKLVALRAVFFRCWYNSSLEVGRGHSKGPIDGSGAWSMQVLGRVGGLRRALERVATGCLNR